MTSNGSPYKNIQIVINPAAGNNEPMLNILNDVFKKYEAVWDARITHKKGDGEQLAREFAANGADLVMAYGGDGTQREVAKGLAGTGVPMCILPGGTVNALAVELGLPLQLAAAVELVFQPEVQVRKIDVIETERDFFLLRAGTGLAGSLSAATDRDLKDRFGWLAYLIGSLRSLTQPEVNAYTITIDGEKVEKEGIACLLTNSNTLGILGLSLSNEVRIDDGLMDVFLIDANWQQLILPAIGTTLQSAELAKSLQHWQGREVTVITRRQEELFADGEDESIGHTPVTAKLLAGALSIITPKPPQPA
jgi:YegS/Rv2252/BmrU family lipid kinase